MQLNRILIYRIGHLGDIVCSIPAMKAVRDRFPNAWIGLLCNKERNEVLDAEKILKGNAFFDEIITYYPLKTRDLNYLFNLWKMVFCLNIDLVVYLSHSKNHLWRLIRDWLFFRSVTQGKLIGFKLPKPSHQLEENGIRIPIFPQETDRLMALLLPLNIRPDNVHFWLPISDSDKEYVDKIWNKQQLVGNPDIIAICPGGKYSSKFWPIERFSQVASILHEQFRAKIILVGGHSEVSKGEYIVNCAGNYINNQIGRTTVWQTAEILRRCNLLIANDCGPVHLAAAVKTPVLGIYSARNYPGEWSPWGKEHTILQDHSLPCRFCSKEECISIECLKKITVDDVIEAARNYLNNPGEG